MSVEKFGRNDEKVYAGINISHLTNGFLRRGEGNTAIGALDIIAILLKM